MKTKNALRSRLVPLVVFAIVTALMIVDYDWLGRIISYIEMGT